MNKKTKKGFTIVELVIVIAVIAILAAVLIPTFSSIIAKANESADIQAVRQMNTALVTESAITPPADIGAVIQILKAAGYNAEDKLIPVSTGHGFYWHSTANLILLIKDEGNDAPKLIYPNDNVAINEAFQTHAENLTEENGFYDLEDGKGYLTEDPTEAPSATPADLLAKGESVTLTEDYELSDVITFPAGSEAELDLNDKELTIAEVSKMVIEGELTIKNGFILAGAAKNPEDEDEEMGIVVGDGGKLILEDVIVTATNPDTYNYSISCHTGGTAEINNCTFKMEDGVYATAIYNNGEMTISDSTFDYSNYTGKGVIQNYGTMTLDGVTVTSGSDCFNLSGSASTTLKGGTYEYSGFLYYYPSFKPTVEIEGASIKGNTVTETVTDGTYGH